MGFRFRRSVKLAPGFKLNVGKRGASFSFGGRGGHVTVNTQGKVTTSAGIPGTGLSYVSTTSRHKGKRTSSGADPSNSFQSYKSRLQKAARFRILFAVIMFLYLFFTTLSFLMGHTIIGCLCAAVTLYFLALLIWIQKTFEILSDIVKSERAMDDPED